MALTPAQKAATQRWQKKNRDKVAAYAKKWREKNKGHAAAYTKRWQQDNAARVDASVRKSSLKRNFGITPEDYAAKLQAQGGVCAICAKPPVDRRLAVDHCHTTGTIRGLLCVLCNTALGKFKDDPRLLQSAINYLFFHS